MQREPPASATRLHHRMLRGEDAAGAFAGEVKLADLRGTPLLVQLFLIFYGLPSVGIVLDAFPAALIGFTLNVGAYTSEGFGAYVRGDTRVHFMEALGFTNEPVIQDLAGESFFVSISEEQVPLLDAPLTVVFPIFVEVSHSGVLIA